MSSPYPQYTYAYGVAHRTQPWERPSFYICRCVELFLIVLGIGANSAVITTATDGNLALYL